MGSLPRISLAYPKTVLALLLAATLAAALGLPRSTSQVGYRAMLGDSHEEIQRLDRHIESFNGGLAALAVWSCKDASPCTSVFDDASIRMASEVEEALAGHPLVLRVETPVSSRVLLATPDGIAPHEFIEQGRISPLRDELARRRLEQEMWRGYVTSEDGRVGAIVVQLDSTDSLTTAQIVPALRRALEPHEAAGFRFYLAGDPIDFVVAGGEMKAETPRLLPVMVGLIALVVYLFTRSLLSSALALGTAGLAVLWTMGMMAWLGWPEIELTQALPPMVLVIGLCDGIHILSRYAAHTTMGKATTRALRIQGIEAVTKEVGPACFITSLTTAAALLSFATSDFDSFVRFGIVAACGVLFALLLSFTLLPILLATIPAERIRNERQEESWDEALGLIIDAVTRQRRTILWLTVVFGILGAVGMSQLRVDIDERELLGENSKVVRWAEFVEDHLRKPDSLEIALQLPPEQTATDPLVVEKVAEIAEKLPNFDGLGRTISYLSFLGPVNRLFHEDDPSWDRPGDTREQNAQLLLVAELEYGGLVSDWISTDRSQLRVFAQAENLSTAGRRDLLQQVSSYLEQTLPSGWDVTLTGPLVVYLALVDEIQRTQLRSFAAAAFIIALLFYVYLRATGTGIPSSVKWTFIGLSPSVLPVVVTLGAMGLMDVPMDAGTAMVAAIILGIAVDDTFHIMSAYRTERKAGLEPAAAIGAAIRRVGRALVTTSFALSIGFFALTLSSWQSIASFGFLSGIAIFAALLADLLVLPAIILTLARVRETPKEPLGPSRVLNTRQRVLLTLGVVAIAGGTLGAVLNENLRNEDTRRLACWIYPNKSVALMSTIDSRCPLQARDQISYLEVDGVRYRTHEPGAVEAAIAASDRHVGARVERDRQHYWVRIPVLDDAPEERIARFSLAALLTLTMLGFALFLVWCSSSPATVPYALLYTTFSVGSTYVLCSRQNELPAAPFVIACALIPSILMHLTLTFPHHRAILRRIPSLLVFIYGCGLALAGVALYGFLFHPLVWQTASAVMLSAIVALWGMLAVSSSLARKDAVTALERVRASSAFWGTLIIPALLFALSRTGWLDNVSLAICAAFFLPLPIGYAMTRYQLFDARPHARQLAFSMGFSLIYTALLAFAWYAFAERSFDALESNPASQLGLLFIILLSAELLRTQLWGYLRERIPNIEAHLRECEEEATHALQGLNTEEETAKLLAQFIRQGLDTTGVSVFLHGESGWRIAAAGGQSPAKLSEIEPSLSQLDLAERPVHLGLEGGAAGAAADRLRSLDLAIVAPLTCRSELLGILLIKEARDRMPYTMDEVKFVRRVAAHTAVALHNARLGAELLRVERYSTIGRIATGLMHDIGKPMAIVWQRAKMMALNADYPSEVRETAGVLESMTDDALSSIDRLMEHAREGLSSPVAEVAAGQVIERAVDAISRIHEGRRVCVRLTPDLPRISGSDELHLALVNLLDNALLASDPDEVTDIYATANSDLLTIKIIDRGCGMSPEVRDHAFDPFFTTRSGKGGSGIGLAASRTTIERLGGTVALESEENAGTTVTIRLALNGDND